MAITPQNDGGDEVFHLPSSDKILVNGLEVNSGVDESLIPPGHDPRVFDTETGLGMSEIWPARFDKDERVVP